MKSVFIYYILYLYEDKTNTINEEENINEDVLNINSIIKNKNKNNNKENKYLLFFNDEKNFILEKYLGMQEYLSFPIFNLQLFYNSLKQKINPEKCPDFSPEKNKIKNLINKVPDPNETWKNFMKRLIKMELYNPPLVDKNKISKTNSLYMKTQMKIISMEYGINMDFKKDDELNSDKINIKNNQNVININNNNFISEDDKNTENI